MEILQINDALAEAKRVQREKESAVKAAKAAYDKKIKDAAAKKAREAYEKK